MPANPTKSEVREARTAAGLSQRQAAELIGYTERAWQDWEGGQRGMRRALLDLFLERARPKRRKRRPG